MKRRERVMRHRNNGRGALNVCCGTWLLFSPRTFAHCHRSGLVGFKVPSGTGQVDRNTAWRYVVNGDIPRLHETTYCLGPEPDDVGPR